MNSSLVNTEMGLQVRQGAAPDAHADREHRQPVTPAIAVRPHRTAWEDTYCSMTEAAHFLGYEDFREIRRYVVHGLLTAYYRPLSSRPIFKRAEVMALVKAAPIGTRQQMTRKGAA